MRRLVLCTVFVLGGTLVLGTPRDIRAQGENNDEVRITVLYDNYKVDDRLTADWGFAALIEYNGQRVLFDTGMDGTILLDNMALLEVDPTTIDFLVLSHEHLDHTGGLVALFEAEAAPDAVFVLSSFSDDIKDDIAAVADVIEVEPGQVIVPGITTTGELTTGPVPEQALLIDTADGLIVITGCAHPGIVEVVRAAKELSDRPLVLVMGGFHLVETSTSRIKAIISDLRDLGVMQIAPSHCTGDLAILLFKREYGEDFIALGAGSVLDFAALEESSSRN